MRLKDIREESELKQFTISKLLGVSRGTYSLWELEKDPIPIKRLNDLVSELTQKKMLLHLHHSSYLHHSKNNTYKS